MRGDSVYERGQCVREVKKRGGREKGVYVSTTAY